MYFSSRLHLGFIAKLNDLPAKTSRNATYRHFIIILVSLLGLKYLTSSTQFYAIRDLTSDNSWAYESPYGFQTTGTKQSITTTLSTPAKQSTIYTTTPTAIKLTSENEYEGLKFLLLHHRPAAARILNRS
ncbi:hypothetical protein DL95DRAFT_138257 [Leptodontidium sp. 2 PMI_412]|nr:hypothetical protein DL95DRAFT_138257 [Leptodontidium sp. 2 PMI_412]